MRSRLLIQQQWYHFPWDPQEGYIISSSLPCLLLTSASVSQWKEGSVSKEKGCKRTELWPYLYPYFHNILYYCQHTRQTAPVVILSCYGAGFCIQRFQKPHPECVLVFLSGTCTFIGNQIHTVMSVWIHVMRPKLYVIVYEWCIWSRVWILWISGVLSCRHVMQYWHTNTNTHTPCSLMVVCSWFRDRTNEFYFCANRNKQAAGSWFYCSWMDLPCLD